MRLKKSFFDSDTNKIAQELLGKKIVRIFDDGSRIEAIITETEAYHGFEDKASHASRKKTERNKIMFDRAGLIYVYLIYGMHWCVNFTTMPSGFPAAVLIRGIAVEDNGKLPLGPELGVEGEIEKLRNYFKIKNPKSLNSPNNLKSVNGPGKVSKLLGLEKSFYGEDLFKSKRIWIEDGIKIQKSDIIAGKRVGVDYAGECKDWKWNYRINFK